jgi:hypothetical protein
MRVLPNHRVHRATVDMHTDVATDFSGEVTFGTGVGMRRAGRRDGNSAPMLEKGWEVLGWELDRRGNALG